MNRTANPVVRRETHSPRSTAAVVVAILLIAATLLVVAESVLQLLGRRPLLVAPRTIAEAVLATPSAGTPVLIAAALASGLAGIWLVALAILPGRRPRRRHHAEHVAVVADDEMLASGLARRAARTAGVSPDAVSVSVGRRRVLRVGSSSCLLRHHPPIGASCWRTARPAEACPSRVRRGRREAP